MNEKTKIPLFAAIGSLPFIVGAILWLANVDAKATTAAAKMDKLEAGIWRMEKRMIRLEIKNGTLPREEQ